jgi:hypothetical protein
MISIVEIRPGQLPRQRQPGRQRRSAQGPEPLERPVGLADLRHRQSRQRDRALRYIHFAHGDAPAALSHLHQQPQPDEHLRQRDDHGEPVVLAESCRASAGCDGALRDGSLLPRRGGQPHPVQPHGRKRADDADLCLRVHQQLAEQRHHRRDGGLRRPCTKLSVSLYPLTMPRVLLPARGRDGAHTFKS